MQVERLNFEQKFIFQEGLSRVGGIVGEEIFLFPEFFNGFNWNLFALFEKYGIVIAIIFYFFFSLFFKNYLKRRTSSPFDIF